MATLKTVTDTASDVLESVEEFGRSAARKFDEAREGTGSKLHSAASSVRKGSAAIDNVATGTADRLDATASYVEDWNLQDVFTGLRSFGRSHLTGSLLVAAAVGFFLGSALYRPSRPRQ